MFLVRTRPLSFNGAIITEEDTLNMRDLVDMIHDALLYHQNYAQQVRFLLQVKKPETLVLPAPGVQSNTLINTKLEKSQEGLGLLHLNTGKTRQR